MPYKVVHRTKDGKTTFAVKNVESGKYHGWTTKEKAEKQLILLRALEHGYKAFPRK